MYVISWRSQRGSDAKAVSFFSKFSFPRTEPVMRGDSLPPGVVGGALFASPRQSSPWSKELIALLPSRRAWLAHPLRVVRRVARRAARRRL